MLPAWDLLTGAYAAFALLAAIRRREATGLGGEVRLPLTDIAMGSAANLGRVAEVLYDGRDHERLGNAVFGTIGRDFVTADGVRLMIVAINERHWTGLVKALDLAEPLAQLGTLLGVRFAGDDSTRFRHREAIFALIEPRVAALAHADLAARLDANAVVHGPYRTMPEAIEDLRLVAANPMFAQTDDNPSGFAYPAAGAFATLPALDRRVPAPAPRLGADSEQILAERLNLSSGEIARLIDAGIVGTAKEPTALILRRAAIVAPIRTPVGKFGGALSSVTAGRLGAVTLKALMERTKIDPARVDDVVFAQGYGNGEAPASRTGRGWPPDCRSKCPAISSIGVAARGSRRSSTQR